MGDIIIAKPLKLKNKSKNINNIPVDICKFIDFVDIPNNFYECFDCYNNNDDISVSTITSQYTMKYPIDLIELKEKLLCNKLIIDTGSCKGFKNQLTLCLCYNYYQDKRKLSIKFFKSGCIHVCGLKTMKMMDIILNICKKLIHKLLNQPFFIEPSKVEICLIAMKINSNQKLDLVRLKRNIAIDFNTYSYYEPSKYSGLNIKLRISESRRCTILVFSSGKMIVCMKTPTELPQIISFVNKMLVSVNGNTIDFKKVNIYRKDLNPLLSSDKI